MEATGFLLQLLLVLLAARAFGELAAFLKIPPLMGEIAAGILLGPSLLSWVEPAGMIRVLAEFGLILLLFEVGLETDVARLMRNSHKSLLVAAVGFVTPFATGFWAAHQLLGLSTIVSLFIGGTLTATSIGVTVRVLKDLGRLEAPEANIVLGAAVIDDIFGVLLLTVLLEFGLYGEVGWTNAGKVATFIVIFLLLAPLLAKGFAVIVRRFNKVSRLPGLIPTLIVCIVLLFAMIAHGVGAPELIGGFAAGLALSRRFYLPFGLALHESDKGFVERIEVEMRPIIQLFTPIFFVMVGLSLNLNAVAWQSPVIWQASALFVTLAFLSKIAGPLILSDPWRTRWAIGLAMIPRAEVGLIFAELGRLSGIFDDTIYAVMVLTIAVTTIAPPFMLKAFYQRTS